MYHIVEGHFWGQTANAGGQGVSEHHLKKTIKSGTYALCKTDRKPPSIHDFLTTKNNGLGSGLITEDKNCPQLYPAPLSILEVRGQFRTCVAP